MRATFYLFYVFVREI